MSDNINDLRALAALQAIVTHIDVTTGEHFAGCNCTSCIVLGIAERALAAAQETPTVYKTLTTEELKILYLWLEHQSLPYDNEDLHTTVKKIQCIIEAEEGNVMVERSSPCS